MNKKFSITVISIFVAMLLVPTIAWGVLHLFGAAEPLKFDTGENRNLASFPKEFNPETVTSEIEAWYNDHLPFRSVLYKAQNELEHWIEQPYDAVIRPVLIDIFHPEQENPASTPTPDMFEELFPTPTLDPTETPDSEVPPTPEDILPTPELITPAPQTPSPDGPTDTQSTATPKPTQEACSHSMDNGNVEKEATCKEWGTIIFTCEKCGYAYREYTNKVAHRYVSDLTTVPVCGTKYTETLTCDMCGDSKSATQIKQHEPGKQLAVVPASFVEYGHTFMQCKDCKGEYKMNITNKQYDNSFFPPIYRSGTVTEGRLQWLFFRGDNSEAYFAGTNLMSQNELRENTKVLQQLNDICKEKGIVLQIAIFPNKDQVYPEYMPTTQVQDEYKRVERFVDYVKEQSDVKIVYPLKELQAAKPYWDLYFKYDTHWNNAGAFIGLQAMYADLGLETTDLKNLPVRKLYDTDSDYSKYVYDGDTGWIYGTQADMISLGGLNGADYKGNFNYVIDYHSDVNVFSRRGAADPWSTRTSKSRGANDLNFVMLGDSYRAFMTNFLEKDFTNCFLTHRDRVFDADVVEAVKKADILVLSSVERYEPDIIQTARELIEILNKA